MSTAPGVYRCPKCQLENTGREDVERKHCSFCDLFAEDLRDELVVELQASEFARGLTRRDGFSVAFWTAHYFGNDQSRVVHGWVLDSWTGQRVQHAWVETPGLGTYVNEATGEQLERPVTIVVDYCQIDERARAMERQRYYTECGVETVPLPKTYTVHQCILNAILYRSDGPWEDGL